MFEENVRKFKARLILEATLNKKIDNILSEIKHGDRKE